MELRNFYMIFPMKKPNSIVITVDLAMFFMTTNFTTNLETLILQPSQIIISQLLIGMVSQQKDFATFDL